MTNQKRCALCMNYDWFGEVCRNPASENHGRPMQPHMSCDEWNEELKPCPFCGSCDIFSEEKYEDQEVDWGARIICRQCGVSMGDLSDSDNVLSELVKRWNVRAYEDAAKQGEH